DITGRVAAVEQVSGAENDAKKIPRPRPTRANRNIRLKSSNLHARPRAPAIGVPVSITRLARKCSEQSRYRQAIPVGHSDRSGKVSSTVGNFSHPLEHTPGLHKPR